MLKYIIKRVLIMIPIFLGLTFIIYLLLSLMPGENAAEAEVTQTILAGTQVTGRRSSASTAWMWE